MAQIFFIEVSGFAGPAAGATQCLQPGKSAASLQELAEGEHRIGRRNSARQPLSPSRQDAGIFWPQARNDGCGDLAWRRLV